MGHFLFIILHVIALLFGAVGLFVTIPLHLIYAVLKSRRPVPIVVAHDPRLETKCPDCAETILKDAKVCKHCGRRFDAPATA